MILDSVGQLKDHPHERERVVVVGAGAIGLYAAAMLIEKGVQVVLVEAGGDHLGGFDPKTYESVGIASNGLKLGRSRSMGGTTNLWGGQLVEFMPVDFEGRDWLEHSRWPVTYADVARHFPETYERLGITPDQQSDEKVWSSVGAEQPPMGDEVEAFLTRWLRTPNFKVLYKQLIEEDPRLLVLRAHTLVGFEGGRTIEALRCVTDRDETVRVNGDTFIMAHGTIEIARVMLHAAQDEAWNAPWKGNDLVGAAFMDHLGGPIGTIKPADTKSFFKTYCTIAKKGDKYQPKVRLNNDLLAREPLYNIQGLFAFESSASEHLVYLKQFLKAAMRGKPVKNPGDVIKNSLAGVKYLFPLMWRYAVDHRVFVPSTSKIILQMQGEHAPTRDSRVRIDPSVRDAQGLPKVLLDWQLGGDEQASIIDFAKRVDASMQNAGLGRLEIEPALLANDPAFMRTLKDTYHQSGGAIMGEHDGDGVVDRDQKVFGTDNLYVAGSAVFRTVGNANTTFTALAMPTRLVHALPGVRTQEHAEATV